MTIEQFFKNPLEGIEPISLEIQVRELRFGFEAVKFINYDYGYQFEIANLLGFDIEHLHNEMRTHWGIEPNVNQN
jgi:hypothetical protein